MGLPAAAVLEGERGTRDNSTSAAAAAFSDSANVGDDPAAAALEDEAKKALHCPCLDDLRDGPCGREFSKAFVCFVKSQQPDKGSDCVEPFEKMQHCMINNPNKFANAHHSDSRGPPTPREGPTVPTFGDESEPDDEDEDEEAPYTPHGLVPPPAVIPESAIRLPPWYKEGELDNQRSR